jgi:hypothetical protein
MVAITERTMARPRGRPKRSERNDRTARVDAQVLGWAEMVAKARGITVAEYLSETLRAPVAKDFGRLMEQMKQGKPPEM